MRTDLREWHQVRIAEGYSDGDQTRPDLFKPTFLPFLNKAQIGGPFRVWLQVCLHVQMNIDHEW